MVNAQAGSMQHTDGGARWVTAIASLMVGFFVFCPVVLAVAIVVGISGPRDQRAGMALDRSGVLGTRVQRGDAMCMGLWMNRPRNARTAGSPEETRGGGFLSIRAESDVLGIFWGMGRVVGG